jgi:putative ABC transport system permease protein
MASTYWNQQNPVGQRLRFGDQKWRTIVGLVGDVHHGGLGTKPEPEMYIPYGQIPNVESRPTIVLCTSIEPTNVTSALRKAVSEVDASVPLDQIETMKQIISVSVGEPRFRTAVLLTFAILALFVASIGLYGVMSYLMNQRTREFGIRVAVGASSGDLLRLVLGQAAKLVCIGICLGLFGAMLLARSIASLLYGVTPFDTATLISVSFLLTAVALLASYIPRVEPRALIRWSHFVTNKGPDHCGEAYQADSERCSEKARRTGVGSGVCYRRDSGGLSDIYSRHVVASPSCARIVLYTGCGGIRVDPMAALRFE